MATEETIVDETVLGGSTPNTEEQPLGAGSQDEDVDTTGNVAVTEPAPEPTEAEKRIAALEAEVKRTNQQYSTLRGNVRKQAELEAHQTRQVELLEALVNHQTDPDADPAVLRDKVASIKTKTTEDLAVSKDRQVLDGYLTSIFAKIANVGMANNDPKLNRAGELLTEAQQGDKIDLATAFAAYQEVLDVVEGEKAAEGAKALDTERKRANRANGTLEAGAPDGTPGTMGTYEDLRARYTGGEQLSTPQLARLFPDRYQT